ncbi:MAG: hypothetical protein MRZ79_10800 [Bacteroidia bacterium]|nr:hypothetical protein [Bacteroidia bacterium]
MKYLQARLRVSFLSQILLFAYVIGLGLMIYRDYGGIKEYLDSWFGLFLFWEGFLLLLFPFELAAGYFLEKQHGRQLGSFGKWFLSWLRGVSVLSLFFALHCAVLILLGNWGGLWAVAGWSFVWMLLLTGFRQYLARLMAPFKIDYESNRGRLLFYFDNPDRGFTGGISGISGQESIIMPAYWQKKWDSTVFDLQLSRRHGALNTGSHGSGVFGSILLHTGLFTLATFLSGNPGSFVSLILTFCIYSLLAAFASIGIIPALNRRGTYQMDRWVFFKKVDGDIINKAIENSRRLQDDPGYPLGSIFKPSASLDERNAIRRQGKDAKGAWHIASVWFYYAMLMGNVTARALPPNLGLPSRWGFTPME